MGDKNYDIKDVTLVVNGIIISGFSTDGAVSIEYNSDHYTFQVGVDGEVTRSRTNDESATITVSLMQTSSSNAVFSSLRQADKLGNLGRFSFSVVDLNGNNFSGNNCTVQKSANIDYQGEAQAREWTLHCPQLNYLNVGGGI